MEQRTSESRGAPKCSRAATIKMAVGTGVLASGLIVVAVADPMTDKLAIGFRQPSVFANGSAMFMQFNMRVDNWGDMIPCQGKSWSWIPCLYHVPARKDSYTALIQSHNPSVFGTQEGTYSQIDDTASILHNTYGLDYAYLGIGRAGGGADSETSALFYKRLDWMVEATGNFMFSETPRTIDTRYEGATFAMITTWAIFASRDKHDRRFLAVATHLDPYSPSVRTKSAMQLFLTVNELLATHGCAHIVLMGDLNAGAKESPHKIFTSSWLDTYEIQHGVYTKHSFTFHDWAGLEYKPEGVDPYPSACADCTLSDPDSPVDFIMAGGNPPIVMQPGSTYLDKSQYLGVWPSDHYPVFARLQFPTNVSSRQRAYFLWKPANKGEKIAESAVSSGNGAYVGRHVHSGAAGEVVVSSDGTVRALRVQGMTEEDASDDCEILVVHSNAQERWVDIAQGDDLPVGAVFSGYNTNDWNMYAARVKIDGVYRACKVNSHAAVLGKLDTIWCWSSLHARKEEHKEGEILVVTAQKKTVAAI